MSVKKEFILIDLADDDEEETTEKKIKTEESNPEHSRINLEIEERMKKLIEENANKSSEVYTIFL